MTRSAASRWPGGRIGAIVVGAGVLLAACGGQGASSPSGATTAGGTTAGTPASVPASGVPASSDILEQTGSTITVPVTTVTGSSGDAKVTVQISVGGGPPATVVLDTGSAGLLIDASMVGSQVVDSGQQLDKNFVGGTVPATLAQAPVTVGGVTTASPVGIGLLQAGSGAGLFDGTSGLLGIGTANGPTLNADLFSPTLQLPAPYQAGSMLDISPTGTGTWTLGPVTAPAGAVAVPLVAVSGPPTTYPDGAPAYAKDVQLCWTIGSAAPACGPTDLDIGNPNTALNSTTFAALDAGGDLLASGTGIVMGTTEKQTLWSFTSGQTQGQNVVELAALGANTEFNAGIEYFYANTVAFDYANGRLLLAPKG